MTCRLPRSYNCRLNSKRCDVETGIINRGMSVAIVAKGSVVHYLLKCYTLWYKLPFNMSYATEECVWPQSHLAEELKSLLSVFFQLADTKADDSGRRRADECSHLQGNPDIAEFPWV
jgi:hypothetical protein